MFKKAKKLMCILLVVLMVIPYAVQASAYKETEAFYGMFSKIVYIVDGNAFYMSNEVMEKALTDEGAIIYLPEETSGKLVEIRCLEAFKEPDYEPEYVTVGPGYPAIGGNDFGIVGGSSIIDADVAVCFGLYRMDGATEEYTFYFLSSDEAEYDESRRIGTSDSTFEYFFYRINDRMVFLEQNEIDELNEKRILKIDDPKIKWGEAVNTESHCCIDESVCGSMLSTDVSLYEYLYFVYWDVNEEPLYEIYVNYDNYVRYENRWYTALEKLLEILERLYDFLFGFIL